MRFEKNKKQFKINLKEGSQYFKANKNVTNDEYTIEM